MSDLKRITPYLCVNEDVGEIRCLGYLMSLTPNEYEILRAVLDAEEGIDRKGILQKLPEELQISENSIAVHICAINKKVNKMGGKKLIKFDRKIKYYVDDCI